MTEEQTKKIFALYSDYNEVITPLIVDIEMKYLQFPAQILNEIRSFTTHIARCTLGTEYNYDEEIKKASRHILRIKLDCYKYLCYYLQEKYSIEFPQQYKNVDLSNINNGEFLIEFRKKLQFGYDATRRAKNIETTNPDESLQNFQDALNKYRELEQYEFNHYSLLVAARQNRNRQKFIVEPAKFLVFGFCGFILDSFFDYKISGLVKSIFQIFL